MTIPELKALHPMPWRYVTLGGNVIVSDAAGKEVPLFTILDFTTAITASIAKNDAK